MGRRELCWSRGAGTRAAAGDSEMWRRVASNPGLSEWRGRADAGRGDGVRAQAGAGEIAEDRSPNGGGQLESVSARIVLESPRKEFGARTIAPDCGESAGVFVPRAYQPPAKQGATRTKQQP